MRKRYIQKHFCTWAGLRLFERLFVFLFVLKIISEANDWFSGIITNYALMRDGLEIWSGNALRHTDSSEILSYKEYEYVLKVKLFASAQGIKTTKLQAKAIHNSLTACVPYIPLLLLGMHSSRMHEQHACSSYKHPGYSRVHCSSKVAGYWLQIDCHFVASARAIQRIYS